MASLYRSRVRRRGEPVFAFVDPDMSPEPFLVDRVEGSALSALIDALAMMPGSSPDVTYYVRDPFGTTFHLASFHSDYDERVWLEEAKRLAVEGGAAAVADHGHGSAFARRYGAES